MGYVSGVVQSGMWSSSVKDRTCLVTIRTRGGSLVRATGRWEEREDGTMSCSSAFACPAKPFATVELSYH